MARTPLLHSIKKVIGLHRDAEAHGLEVSAEQDRRADQAERTRGGPEDEAASGRGLSRRKFLAGAAAVGAAGTLLAPGKMIRASGQPRIVIVGAGIAGMNCAITLTDAGIPCTVYEASPLRVGGRLMSSGGMRGFHGQGGGCDRCHSPYPPTPETHTCRTCHPYAVAGGSRNGFWPPSDPHRQNCTTCHAAPEPPAPGTVAPYWADGQVVDVYGELIDSQHLTIRHLLSRFDLTMTRLAHQTPGSDETYHFSGQYYPREDARRDFRAIYQALKRDTIDAGYPTTWEQSTAAGRALDAMSIAQWIDSRVPGGRGSQLGKLLDVAYNIEFGAETSDQTALSLVSLLGYNCTPGSFTIFGQSDERFHVQGGVARLVNAMGEHLGVNTTIKLGWKLEAIRQNAGGSYQLDFLQATHHSDTAPGAWESRSITADIVVLALPFAVLRDLEYSEAGFDARKHLAIQELGRGVNGKTHLQFNDRLWDRPGPWGLNNGTSYSDTYQLAWDPTAGEPGASGILAVYTGGDVTRWIADNDPDRTKRHGLGLGGDHSYDEGGSYAEAIAQYFLPKLDQVFPGLAGRWNGRTNTALPHLNPRFGAAYSYWRVGQMQTIAGYERVRQGNVLFAGEHTSLDAQGWFEGAAQEGERAGRDILAQLK